MFHFSYYLSKLSILTLIFLDFKYFFTCLIVSSLKWKTDAANTAEAPPNFIPSKKSFKQPKKITHIVRRGDTLSEIAEKYKVNVKSIKKWNGLKNNDIRIGWKLTIYK